MTKGSAVTWVVAPLVIVACMVMLFDEDSGDSSINGDMAVAGHGQGRARAPSTDSWFAGLQTARATRTREPRPHRQSGRPKRGVHSETHQTFVDRLRPSPTRPRVVTPTHGEGAPEDDWDDVSPKERVSRALAQYEAALEKARAASSEGVRDEFRQSAMEALSAVRADMVQIDGNIDRYATLQEAIDD